MRDLGVREQAHGERSCPRSQESRGLSQLCDLRGSRSPSFCLRICQVRVLAETTPKGPFRLRRATPADACFPSRLHTVWEQLPSPRALIQSSLKSAKPPTGFCPLGGQRAERPVAGSRCTANSSSWVSE